MSRKGMGSGTGKGYKNIAGSDPRIHSQSASGIKQAQQINVIQPTKENPYFNAGEILKQLGGNKFIAMTGANTFVKDDKNSQIIFKIPKAKDSINYIKIKLNSMDTYDMEFIRIRGDKITTVNKVNGVYNDQLQEIFTENTGLYTHL